MFESLTAAGPGPVAPWARGLTEAQALAARHGDEPLLILAGAGTGKTRALVSRLACLLDRGASPERTLLLTFARRAADEMILRAGSFAAGRRAFGGTFHSVAHRVLGAYSEVLSLPSQFSVLSPGDGCDLMELMRAEHGLSGAAERFPRAATLVEIYSRCINSGRTLSDLLETAYPWCERHRDKIAALFASFTQRKRQGALLDFDDLLLFWRALLLEEKLGPQLAEQWDYVLVDEYQDLNHLQVDIVRMLAPAGHGLTVVGDEAQAIYGFRGGGPADLRQLVAGMPASTVLRLEENFRSFQGILDVANTVRRTCKGPDVVLRSERGTGTKPRLVRCYDTASEARLVTDEVLRMHEDGVALHEQAVLVRASHHSDLIEIELTARGVPYHKYGGLKFLEVAHVKDFVAAARLVDNPHDEIAWYRLLRLHEGIGVAKARSLVQECRSASDAVATWPEVVAAAPPRARSSLSQTLAALLRARQPTEPGLRAAVVMEAVAPLVQSRYMDAASRLADLERLAGAATGARDLARWLAELTIDPPQSAGDYAGPPHLDEDFLVVSTIHSAKGLEWPIVHVPHVVDGCIPIDLALSTSEGLEEERRLFYVAVTRARDQLHLYSPLRMPYHPRASDDRHGLVKLSRFVDGALLAQLQVIEESVPRPAFPLAEASARVTVDLSSLWG